MRTRLSLQTELEKLLGVKHVYFQPPAGLLMEYPAIRYSKSEIDSKYANNSKYIMMNVYEIVIIDKKPDNPVIQKILELPYTDFVRHYKSDNLNHDIIKIYY